MKTSKKQKNKFSTLAKIAVAVGVVSVMLVVGIQDQDSMSEKYKIGKATMKDTSQYEVSYINLTGKKTIEERKIRLSEGYWTSGKFDF